MNYDIPLPVDLPAGAPNLAWWQVSCLQAVNDRFQSVAITGRANRECRLSTHLSRSRRGPANGRSGARRAVPAAKAERPLSVRSKDLRCRVRQRRGRADSSHSSMVCVAGAVGQIALRT
jgi:hypothetical protein